jgi:hypothetical protein
MASFAESFNAAYALRPHMLQLGFLKLLHGAPMRENPRRYPCRYADTPPYEVLETPWLTAAELSALHKTEEALDKLYNSGRFSRTLDYALRVSGLTRFELFSGIGRVLSGHFGRGISLDTLTELIYRHIAGLSGVDARVLRDKMVCDRLATNAAGKLPGVLRVRDAALGRALRLLELDPTTKKPDGVRRGGAILYTERVLVYADYTDKDPVTGEYALRKVSLP